MENGGLSFVSPQDLNADEDVLGWGVIASPAKMHYDSLWLVCDSNPCVWVQVAGTVKRDAFLDGLFPVPERGIEDRYREMKLGRRRCKIASLHGEDWLLVPPPTLSVDIITLWASKGRLQNRPTTDETKSESKRENFV